MDLTTLTGKLLIGAAALAAVLLVCLIIALASRASLKKCGRAVLRDGATGALTEAGLVRQLVGKSRGALQTLVSLRVPELTEMFSLLGPEGYAETLSAVYGALSNQLGADALVTRTGEDSFAFALKTRDKDEIELRLNNAAAALARAGTRRLTPVFGVYFPEPDDGAKAIDRAALAALTGGAQINYYDADRAANAFREKETADALRRSLREGSLSLLLQPEVRLSDLQVDGAEVMLRWRHQLRGLLSEEMFVPLAENYGFTADVDLCALEMGCRRLEQWTKEGREPFTLTVRLSRGSLFGDGAAGALYDICSKHNVASSTVEFAMDEPLLTRNVEASRSFISALHGFGFRVAIDRFGAGPSSLRLLGELDLDAIRLDSSFFSGENNSRRGRHLLEALLRLAAQMRIRTVATGVDSQKQVGYLQQAACGAIQGHSYFKPMPPERFETDVYSDTKLRHVLALTDAAGETGQQTDAEEKPFQDIVLFSYQPRDDLVTFSDAFSPILNGQTYFKNASSLFKMTELIHPNDRDEFIRMLDQSARSFGWVENTLRFCMAENRYAWLELRMHSGPRADVPRVTGMMVDLDGWRNQIDRWKDKAARDPLTGLYNQATFLQKVRDSIDTGNCTEAAVLFVDVDDFKQANDKYGHHFGDTLLCYVAKQLNALFRHTDVIARYGGDEFVVFAPPKMNREVLVDRLDRLFEALSHPYRDETVQYKLSLSIGAAMYPDDGTDPETLLRHADCAAYEAKKAGKNRYVLYTPDMRVGTGEVN